MKAKRTSLLSSIIGFTFALLLNGSTPLAAQDSCQPTYDAMAKSITVPTHIYTSMTDVPNNGDKPVASETIYFEGSSYGKWTRSPMTSEQVMKKVEEDRKNSKTTCRYLKDEMIKGEPAAVYSTRSDTGDIRSEGQFWISKTKGLPLKQELDIELSGTKKHHSVRYEYANVQPPPIEK
jgi:hypothetical protein